MTVFIAIALVAVGAGLFGSMLGVGGGVIIVPVLTLGFGVPIKQAIATSMICVISTSAVAQLAFMRRGMTNTRLGFTLEIASAAGAVVGGITAVLVDARVLQIAFAVVLAYVVWQMSRRRGDVRPVRTGVMESSYLDPLRRVEVTYGVRRVKLGFLLSIGAGNVAGLLGVGGGVFKVPIMNLAMGAPLRAAIATSNLMIDVTAATGAVLFYSYGLVDPAYAVPAVLGVLLGARFGPFFALRLPEYLLSLIFRVVLGLFAILMIAEAAGVKL